ncbi:aminoacyl-tRNA hydrolase [candidate division KSB1 bacterium]|nr:aminoacyl-tRNA hydrolase [candidate division KSB1 bacterium]
MIKAMAFLGNPGAEYALTRHNFAWMLIDHSSWSQLSWQNKFQGQFATALTDQQKIWMLKPITFMNKSGKSVQALLSFYKLQPDELIIVHDDLEMNFGVIGFRKGGGLAGHNGLRSIANSMGTQEFYRFRLGISRPQHGNISSYVLSKFNDKEKAQLPGIMEHATVILKECIKLDPSLAEQRYRKNRIL